jgi:hypothetical protein
VAVAAVKTTDCCRVTFRLTVPCRRGEGGERKIDETQEEEEEEEEEEEMSFAAAMTLNAISWGGFGSCCCCLHAAAAAVFGRRRRRRLLLVAISAVLMFSLENCFYSWVRVCGRVGVLPGMTSGRRRRRRCATTDRLGADHPERG